MKTFTLLALLPALALALPQNDSPSTITTPPAAPTAALLTPQQSCAVACPAGDVTCQAQCLGIARPNSSQASETNECAAKCDQGDGSPADTQKFSDCVQDCIAKFFPSSQTAGDFAPSGGNPTTAPTNAADATGGAGASGTSTGDNAEETGTDSDPAQSSNAASSSNGKVVGGGIAGLVLALLAL